MKDNFSIQAKDYARFRPVYPASLIEHIISLTHRQERAWDCATGNGQIAAMLFPHFKEVYATDISERQLEHAVREPNIFYRKEQAEHPSFPDDFFDLVTVGQAVHWFDFEAFFSQVKRVGRKGGIISLIGYGLFKTHSSLDSVIRHFYESVVGPYWDPERRFIEEEYRTIGFPFEEIEMPHYEIRNTWSLEAMAGYLNTWSAVQHYIKAKGKNPVDSFLPDLKEKWGGQPKVKVYTPIILRTGRI